MIDLKEKTITHIKTPWLDLGFDRRLTPKEKQLLMRDPYAMFEPPISPAHREEEKAIQ